jgi:Sulfotransferase family
MGDGVMRAMAATSEGTEDHVRVLYIAGLGRSGSTLLDQILGSQLGFFSAGELDFVWPFGVLEDRLCACGQPFSRCTFWKSVRLADPDLLTPEAATRISNYHDIVLRSRWMYQLWWKRGRNRTIAKAPPDYFDRIARLYRAVALVSGGQIIVDSSKHPTYAYLLSRSGVSPSMEMVHLVRDPRAVAFSWMRHKVDLGAPDRSTYLPRFRPTETAMLWLEWNRTVEMIAATCGMSYRRLRYEDFVENPEASLRRLRVTAGSPAGPATRTGTSPRPLLHTVSGNPSRFDPGPFRVRRDDEWRTGMRGRDALAVSLISSPALRRYGYRLRARLAGSTAH